MKSLFMFFTMACLTTVARADYQGREEDLVPGTLVAKDVPACAVYAAKFILNSITTSGLKSPEQLNATRDGIGIMCLVKPPGEVDVDMKNMFEDVTYATAIKIFSKSDPNVVAFAKQHHLDEKARKETSPGLH